MINSILRKLLSSVILCGFAWTSLNAQNIEIKVNQEPLNEVLYSLGLTYDFQFSFSDNLLANCVISDSSSYESMDAALESLLAHCDYEFKVTNDVFVIYLEQTRRRNTNQKILYLYRDQGIDRKSETLPYTSIIINGTSVYNGTNGYYIYRPNEGII